ncbi:enoyl-CoA hydratase/isomerase family protein [Asticcacaulis excentricus]|uniref:3-hydroxyisobutyryl-CoA hydrolase n=1 Tax=Asticcacaulis excentricus (strain ATCC 15261 / DSM 4724 / KCTC 12464 / NCIMB 9791 / VKM B-1370 / CB 48) TaxID=573065 RepID=E8RLF2_ASTEC|nr:3-hydroxyisobutyryl-CoA hydrolase [Asticcacaulis excentricus]ADU13696.1 Enoyl-CoA hydratase/isomerase [Asticcacaulis excentricus CB 48]
MDALGVEEKPVLAQVENGVGRLTLNRPQALNALTTAMCRDMAHTLSQWAADDRVRYVVLDHSGRAFCAGGDVRAAARSGRADGEAAREFFRTEYRLNTLIKRFPKPFVALIDGVTMGGGVGISVHGSHRVSTENTLFAMPETGIGLFPDVGGGWFLPRMVGETGTWLALTGERLKGTDVRAAQISTHHVAAADLPALKAELLAGGDIDNILHRYDRPVGEPSYTEHLEVINRIFGKATLADIAIALKLEDSDWAQHQGEVLATRSPFSMSVTLRHLREGRRLETFEQVMEMEFRIASRLCQSHDFLEGVRAVLEDKDHSPHWLPQSIGCVSARSVEALFAPLSRELYD